MKIFKRKKKKVETNIENNKDLYTENKVTWLDGLCVVTSEKDIILTENCFIDIKFKTSDGITELKHKRIDSICQDEVQIDVSSNFHSKYEIIKFNDIVSINNIEVLGFEKERVLKTKNNTYKINDIIKFESCDGIKTGRIAKIEKNCFKGTLVFIDCSTDGKSDLANYWSYDLKIIEEEVNGK